MYNTNIEYSKKLINRLCLFLNIQGDNFNKLSLKIGVSNSYFSKMAKKGGNIGTEIAEKILLYYENLNPDWLLTGRGEMLRDIKHAEPELSPIIKDTVPYPEPKKKCLSCEEKEKVIIAYNETINSLKQTVSIQNELIEYLKRHE